MLDNISRGSRNVGDDRSKLSDYPVEYCRFSYVGRSYQSYFHDEQYFIV